jgi:hypothetical protein
MHFESKSANPWNMSRLATTSILAAHVSAPTDVFIVNLNRRNALLSPVLAMEESRGLCHALNDWVVVGSKTLRAHESVTLGSGQVLLVCSVHECIDVFDFVDSIIVINLPFFPGRFAQVRVAKQLCCGCRFATETRHTLDSCA